MAAGWCSACSTRTERLYRGILLLAIVVVLATRGPWVAVGVAVAVMVAATTSYLGLEAIAVVTDRARPQSVFALVVKPPGVDRGQASYPSGHATVTMTMAAGAGLALPVLRWPMALLVVVIAWSRVAFGAHFPLDVLAALVLGYVGAVLGVAFACASGLLPARADAR